MLDAITTYDLGYTLDKTTERIRIRYGHRIGRSTIAAWLAEHEALTTYRRLRAAGRRLYVLFRSGEGAGVNTRLHDAQRQS